jgi:spore coat polysaccharide biosynthesis protein SpsF (cytidylyltransferase family)
MSEKKITVMIQARTGSSRLPGKVLSRIENKNMIWHVINRTKKIKSVQQIALITTDKKSDQILLDIAKEEDIIGFTGDEKNVLNRHYQCALKITADPIIRITSDCPVVDFSLVEDMLQFFLTHNYDYVSNIHPPTYPDGLDIEIFSFQTLEKTSFGAKLKSEKEHVTPYIHKHPELFNIFNFENNEDLSHIRLTVDEKEDLELIQNLYSIFSPKDDFGLHEIKDLLVKNPTLFRINSKYQRNEGHLQSLKEDEIE